MTRTNSKNANSRPGFTLIELIVVIFILSIASALIIPSLINTGKGSLKADAKRMGSALRYVYDESVSKKKDYLFYINLDDNSYGFTGEGESKKFRLEGEIYFKDIIIPSLGARSDGEVTVRFGPLGPEEPIILHLANKKEEYSVFFNNISGRAGIYEGYKL